MLEGIRAGIRAASRSAGGDEIVGDVNWDGQSVQEGARLGIRAGVQGGIRAIGGGAQGLPGAPPRIRKDADSNGSGDPLRMGLLFPIVVPNALTEPGTHNLQARVRADSADLPLIELNLRVESRKVASPEAPDAGEAQIVERTVELGEIGWPDADDDGVSTLTEIAVMTASKGFSEALIAAGDSSYLPSEADAEVALPVFNKSLQQALAAQGVKAEVSLPPIDLTAPETALSAAGAEPSGSASPVVSGQSIKNRQEITFAFSCNEASCTYRCSLAGAEGFDARPCTSPFVLSLSKDGGYTLTVITVDAFGNRDRTPAVLTFTVLPAAVCGNIQCEPGETWEACPSDCTPAAECGNRHCEPRETEATCPTDCDKTPPETAISSQPSAVSNATTAKFEFSCSDPVGAPRRVESSTFTGASSDAGVKPAATCTFMCQLDVGTPSSCVSPVAYAPVTEGAHSFSVYAVDPAGNKDLTPASFSWTVDTTAPTVAISGQPSAISNQTSATFTFASPDASATFQCQFDQPLSPGSYAACTTPLTLSLSKGDGTYSFLVRAVDVAGNVDSTPASYTWTLDTTAPSTAFSSQPSAVSNSTSASFAFGSADATATFECSLDGAAYAACSSPVTHVSLLEGAHTYSVRAKDPAGNVGPAASYTWTIDLTASTFAGLTSATAVSASQIDLAWTAATDNTSASSLIAYDICRATVSGGCATFATTCATSAGATSFGDTGTNCGGTALSAGTRYSYVVRARDQAGNTDTNTVEKSARTWSAGVAQSISNHLAHHTCSVLTNGTLKCWGLNGNGQLGDGTTMNRPTPVGVSGLSAVVAVSGGIYHTCALMVDGTVKCWGRNLYGEAGDGTTVQKSTPVAVSSLSGVVATAGGAYHTCSLLSGGTVKCWGYNANGQLGEGSTVDKWTPVAVSSLSGVVAVTGANEHTCSLLYDGTVKCWGLNGNGQLGDGTAVRKTTPVAVTSLSGAVAVAGGRYHTCSLLSDGTANCWGYNANGEVGDGTSVDRSAPAVVTGLSSAVSLSPGDSHSCALLSNGTVKCWGRNDAGQLGDGSTANKAAPTAVSGLSNVLAIAAGDSHTCSHLADGTIRCWGLNASGQLGDGTTAGKSTPVAVSLPALPIGVIAPDMGKSAGPSPGRRWRETVGGGNSHSCVLMSDGTSRCWGNNSGGRLGDGTIVDRHTPVQGVSNLTNLIEISAGLSHTCFLTSEGRVLCIGYNSQGQLGDGTTVIPDPPLPVTVTSLSSVVDVCAADGSGNFSCALLADGSARCWGDNVYGQLGDGTTVSRFTPIPVTSLSGAAALTAGGGHACALRVDGSVVCWGLNASGQLGDGTTASHFAPASVTSLTSAVALSGGNDHVCALLADGAVYCWGVNTVGEIGDGTTANRTTPVAVSSLTGIVSVNGGSYQTCAVTAAGFAYCWGYNAYGEIGDGTVTDRHAPVMVSSLSAVTRTGGGAFHTCATLADGSARCWGRNIYGGLGDGTTIDRLVPVAVSFGP